MHRKLRIQKLAFYVRHFNAHLPRASTHAAAVEKKRWCAIQIDMIVVDSFTFFFLSLRIPNNNLVHNWSPLFCTRVIFFCSHFKCLQTAKRRLSHPGKFYYKTDWFNQLCCWNGRCNQKYWQSLLISPQATKFFFKLAILLCNKEQAKNKRCNKFTENGIEIGLAILLKPFFSLKIRKYYINCWMQAPYTNSDSRKLVAFFYTKFCHREKLFLWNRILIRSYFELFVWWNSVDVKFFGEEKKVFANIF